ncbi:glycosyltransferase family 4 protein [Pedobacter deserti]|uniref:glycosyltransferase family 4 protein n=1 Tax=Pedobacter deserti TaxID=2817382 RepID=UPI00210A049B|nr:glycosyltransferase family 1 protein [Pedobacter sp. SYSU D00382]
MMKKIKVAFFAEILVEDFDGAARTMFQLIKRIDPSRFEFLFVCGVGPDKLVEFECIKLPIVTLPINATYTMALPGLMKKQLKKRLREFMPDLVHIATPSLLGGFALKYANRQGLPVMTIYHTHFVSYIDYYLKYAPFLIEKVKQMLADNQKLFYNRCDTIYVPSTSIMTELTRYGVDSNRMKLWKRGINARLFSPDKRDARIIERLTGNNRPAILFASRLVWEKNLETLFKIYDGVQGAGLDVNFIVAGDGIAKRACQSRMKRAVFVGKLGHDALSALYASSSIFLFPSVSETYGNVVLEAMASGLPCIIADGGGSADFVKDGVNGFKCAPYDADHYVMRIRRLLSDRQLARQFSAAGLAQCFGLDWDQLATAYFDEVSLLAARREKDSYRVS